ncbi:hypothetical protein [Chryseobacterium sp.]|uniref:hypothetical protein n=1 Tax=Chryseobacterium sp. TaxID=1871047 RepID=UPI0025C3BBBB|nr:hypothetical protein [Chryseobacterium sp.]MBV8328493.1 hypothetical protein [Chryseobacterium sp.]
MKKIVLTLSIFCFTFFYSQKNQNYLQIGYASICCGPPSDKPVMSYLKEFKKKNQIRSMEILVQNGLGREGEFNVYVATDALTKNQKSRLIRGLYATVSNQNNKRAQNSSGMVNFDSAVVVHHTDLDTKNLTIYKK